MVSEGGEDVAHHAGAGPGVEDRCPVAGPHVAAKEPACNRRGSVSPTQHAPLVILRPAIVDLCSLLAALGTERALQMLGPAGITQINASNLIVSLPEPASSMPNILCTLQRRSKSLTRGRSWKHETYFRTPPSEDSLSHRTGVSWTPVCTVHRFNHYDRCRTRQCLLPSDD